MVAYLALTRCTTPCKDTKNPCDPLVLFSRFDHSSFSPCSPFRADKIKRLWKSGKWHFPFRFGCGTVSLFNDDTVFQAVLVVTKRFAHALTDFRPSSIQLIACARLQYLRTDCFYITYAYKIWKTGRTSLRTKSEMFNSVHVQEVIKIKVAWDAFFNWISIKTMVTKLRRQEM